MKCFGLSKKLLFFSIMLATALSLSPLFYAHKLEIDTTNLSSGESYKEYLSEYPEDAPFPFCAGSFGSLPEADPIDNIYSPNIIFDPDDRNIVDDTTRIPYRYIGLLVSDFGNVKGVGTAFLVGDNIVLTAAHCIYHNKTTAEHVTFIPAKNGTVQKFGSYDAASLHIPTKYKTAANASTLPAGQATPEMSKYDYALIELNYDLGAMLGYFGIGGYNTNYNSSNLVGKKVTVAGYPAGRGNKLYRHKD